MTNKSNPTLAAGDWAPVTAFPFAAASPVKFASDDQPQIKSKPFEMTVRTRGPVAHWYFAELFTISPG